MRSSSLALAALLAGAPLVAAAQAEAPDHLALAALLIHDGHPDRAAIELRAVDPEAEGVDAARYWLLSGLIAHAAGDAARTAEALDRAASLGAAEPRLHLLRAQALARLDRHGEVLAALEAAGPALRAPGTVQLELAARRALGDTVGAFAALQDGLQRFPQAIELERQAVLMLVELGLFQAAAERGAALLERPEAGLVDHLAFGEALRRAGASDRASAVLERARLRHPEARDVAVALARAELDAGRPRVAARVLAAAEPIDPALVAEAAELHRRGGQLDRALYLNRRVRDPRTKARQRLGLLVERERYEAAAALAERLSRLGLLEDGGVAYALAFAQLRGGQLEAAERSLARVDEPELFERASALRRAIETCRADPGACP